MKKTAFIALVFMCVNSMIFAQETPDKILENENFNEIKINAAFLIAGALEVGYERTINEESAFGISALVSFDEDLKDEIRYYISPYYRFISEKNMLPVFLWRASGC